jgi:hypothetical protein
VLTNSKICVLTGKLRPYKLSSSSFSSCPSSHSHITVPVQEGRRMMPWLLQIKLKLLVSQNSNESYKRIFKRGATKVDLNSLPHRKTEGRKVGVTWTCFHVGKGNAQGPPIPTTKLRKHDFHFTFNSLLRYRF